MLFWEIIFSFPKGIKKVLSDLRVYRLIQDAAASPCNTWTGRQSASVQSKKLDFMTNLRSAPPQNRPFLSINYFTTIHSTIIPRQQQEFQRRLKRDLRKILLPVVAYTMLPVVGNFFMLLPAIAPRQFISRHFLQDDSIKTLALMEYDLRKVWYTRIARDFWLSPMIPFIRDQFYQNWKRPWTYGTHDFDGTDPTFINILSLLVLFLPMEKMKYFDLPSITTLPIRFIISLDALSSSSLYDLARSHGIASSSMYLQLVPNAYLRKRLLSIAQDIVDDDTLLILEDEHLNQCNSLNDDEVLDACLLRGLPISTTPKMRTQLTYYLFMVQPLYLQLIQTQCATTNDDVSLKHKHTEAFKKAIHTLILFLPAISYDLNNSWIPSSDRMKY